MTRFANALLLILLALACAVDAFAQQTYTARVVDAATNEPLPFAQVYVGEGRGAVTNYQGTFSINASPDETFKISYIGYTSAYIMAADLPQTVRLKATEHQLREVTVTPIQPLLVRASKKLYAEYKKHRTASSTFFLRIRNDFFSDSATWAGHKAQMTEAFIQGQSAVNLRQPVALTGYRSGWVPANLYGSGYQWFQLGVMMHGDEIKLLSSNNFITPLHRRASKKYYEKYYHITYTTVNDESGRHLRRITFRRWDDVKEPIITGTLLLDVNTLEPISFDGIINNIRFLLNVDQYRALETIQPRFHIDYRHDHGFTEVAHLFARNRMSKLDERYTMVNVGAVDLPDGVQIDRDNFWAALDSAGFNQDFWQEHETVMRTADEDALFSLKQQGKADFYDSSIPDVEAEKHLAAEQRAKREQRHRDSIALSRISGILIYDSVARKPIPFARVTALSNNRHTMSNLQGFFYMKMGVTDTLRFHAYGYEGRRLPVAHLSRIVYLSPLKKDLMPFDITISTLLARLSEKLMAERQAHEHERAPFFFRRLRKIEHDTIMTEAILNVSSALQITQPTVVHGHHFVALHNDTISDETLMQYAPEKTDSMLMDILNPNHINSETARKLREQIRETTMKSYDKMTKKKGDFRKPFVPLLGTGREQHYKRHYDLSLVPLRDRQGRHYVRIIFDRKPNWRYPVITGEMLIDLDSLRLLSFDGILDGKYAVFSRTRKDYNMISLRPYISIHYDFSHERGFTEVMHAAFHTSVGLMDFSTFTEEWYVMMNCHDMTIPAESELGNTVVRMYDEERVTRHPRLPLTKLLPELITFDIFSEKADWRLLM